MQEKIELASTKTEILRQASEACDRLNERLDHAHERDEQAMHRFLGAHRMAELTKQQIELCQRVIREHG